ncbi:uncharacterized protein LOC115173364 isoform X3 [Salmo trutta]|uniref:uncharacterized protein LOC115173364 isoform X3 n=1 Tax=Salmo trutta TaxID=8032 RepID=UPI0011328090|nr:uncharacterized protein LOC115173364 isoform X3 [Salmo trutta]
MHKQHFNISFTARFSENVYFFQQCRSQNLMGHQKWCNTVDLALIFIVLPLNVYLLCQTSLHVSVKMLVQVKYSQQQKYVKLDEDEGRFDFMQFHENEFSDFSLSSASETSDSSFSSSASTIILDDVPSKRQRIEDTHDAVSAEQLIEAVLRGKSGGEEVLQEYQTTETLTDAARRKMVNILVAHMIDNHGHRPTKAIREDYARGIVMLFPSLKDPYSKKGYEHFYDAASSTGYISWRLKTVQRKIR